MKIDGHYKKETFMLSSIISALFLLTKLCGGDENKCRPSSISNHDLHIQLGSKRKRYVGLFIRDIDHALPGFSATSWRLIYS